MQLAANFTYWKQAPCPQGLISGATQQVGMEKATSSFCSSLTRQWGPGNEGCTAAADGWKICLNYLLEFFSQPNVFSIFHAWYLKATLQQDAKNDTIHSTTHRQRIQNEANHSLQPSPSSSPAQNKTPLLRPGSSGHYFCFAEGRFQVSGLFLAHSSALLMGEIALVLRQQHSRGLLSLEVNSALLRWRMPGEWPRMEAWVETAVTDNEAKRGFSVKSTGRWILVSTTPVLQSCGSKQG